MNHQPKKKFGQNFLRDKNLLLKIVRESYIEHKNVIEIGPGQGALTSFLAEKASFVKAYEIDETLKPLLSELEIKYPNLSVIYQDFLEVEINDDQEYHVVANIPYNITSPILFKILETSQIRTASIMIQKEVADRLLAKPGTKDYNALSILLQIEAKAYKMVDVKRQMFYPVPNVDSAVIRIEKFNNPIISSELMPFLRKMVKEAFRQKRKTLVNNWHEAYKIEKKVLIDFLIEQGVDPYVRAESLSIDTFLKLREAWPYDC
ncbi:MAG: 16S rRNA (adenine(1518)-N(6)/adenine(1519)-N(6))-dimethyltransferase RsmA [Acholeplasmataceae bacterium]